jgi:hypothetical protein
MEGIAHGVYVEGRGIGVPYTAISCKGDQGISTWGKPAYAACAGEAIMDNGIGRRKSSNIPLIEPRRAITAVLVYHEVAGTGNRKDSVADAVLAGTAGGDARREGEIVAARPELPI